VQNLSPCRRQQQLPDAVQHVSVGEDADVDVVDEDGVEVSGLLVAEERVGHPHLAGVGQRQVAKSTCKRRRRRRRALELGEEEVLSEKAEDVLARQVVEL
jgi:hypothetical protein